VTKSAPPEAPPAQRSSAPLVIGIAVVVVLIAAVVAIVLTGGDDGAGAPPGPGETPVATEPDTEPEPQPDPDDGITTGSGDDPRLPAALVGEAGFVEIEGAPLPDFSPDGDDPAIGMRPPLLVASDVGTGTGYTISPDIDGPVMLVFLAHWCPACDEEVPHLAELDRDGRLPDELDVYGVLTAMDPARPNFPASEWVSDRGWTWPAVADGVNFDADPAGWAAADAFGLTAYPYVVVYDDGVVVDRWAGGLGVDGLEARIAAAVS
jgi:cytochrome c biogenesis protein CcmG, thiol:disulfide interchange protein DsbE